MIEFFTWLLLIAFGVFLLLFVVYSFLENEKRALLRGIITLLFYGLILVVVSTLPTQIFPYLLVAQLLILIIILLKFGNRNILFKIPENRYDERDVMFSRDTLKAGTERFNSYYKMRPENKPVDDNFRNYPGLLEKGTFFYNELLYSASKATFSTVDLLNPLVEQAAVKGKSKLSGKEISEFIKNWTKQLGAVRVGFALIKPHHVYTHVGRGEQYGEEVELDHNYAIAFTVEMEQKAMSYNPKGPVILESAQQYLNAGRIAVQLTEFLRNLGYEARAHIDANYRLICPIVAQDAGLGAIGRMGLLMTPELGPRVRVGAVSTNLELPAYENPPDSSVIQFCEICKKCAVNCPTQSIPTNSYKENNPPKRWKINHEICFTYWRKAGTDCGRCIAVCPYSHPNNFIHNTIRWMIKRNPLNRRLALQLDDFFYGRKPASAKLKRWMTPESNKIKHISK
ncbi:MAG: reductive dehalogenase domain-containing protein [Bacteroidota bacterium]